MVAQAFLFNSVFFTYGLVLAKFYHVNETRIGLYILPLAAGNLLGPLVLGPSVRHRRPAQDDGRHVRRVRRAAGGRRRCCSAWAC